MRRHVLSVPSCLIFGCDDVDRDVVVDMTRRWGVPPFGAFRLVP